MRYLHKVLKELAGDVLIGRVVHGKLKRHVQHGDAEKGHPSSAVRLQQVV
jgi:hypothetical protein